MCKAVFEIFFPGQLVCFCFVFFKNDHDTHNLGLLQQNKELAFNYTFFNYRVMKKKHRIINPDILHIPSPHHPLYRHYFSQIISQANQYLNLQLEMSIKWQLNLFSFGLPQYPQNLPTPSFPPLVIFFIGQFQLFQSILVLKFIL